MPVVESSAIDLVEGRGEMERSHALAEPVAGVELESQFVAVVDGDAERIDPPPLVLGEVLHDPAVGGNRIVLHSGELGGPGPGHTAEVGTKVAGGSLPVDPFEIGVPVGLQHVSDRPLARIPSETRTPVLGREESPGAGLFPVRLERLHLVGIEGDQSDVGDPDRVAGAAAGMPGGNQLGGDLFEAESLSRQVGGPPEQVLDHLALVDAGGLEKETAEGWVLRQLCPRNHKRRDAPGFLIRETRI